MRGALLYSGLMAYEGFAKVAASAGEGKKGDAIAAAAGRKKYGKAQFQRMAAEGRKRAAKSGS